MCQNLRKNPTNFFVAFDYTQIQYGGQWVPQNTEAPFNALYNKQGGKIKIRFYQDTSGPKIEFLMYDGQYIDQTVIQIMDFPIQQIAGPPNTIQWSGMDKVIAYRYFQLKEQTFDDFMINYSIELKSKYNSTITSPDDIIINFQMQSFNQNGSNFKVYSLLTENESVFLQKTIYFNILILTMVAIQIYALNSLGIQIITNIQDRNRISMIGLGLVTSYDFYFCIEFIFRAYNLEFYFLLPVILFTLQSINQIKLLVYIWQTRYASQYTNQNQLRKGYLWFVFQLYVCIFSLNIFLFVNALYSWAILITFIFMVPQIIHSMHIGQPMRKQILPYYCLFVLPRALYFFYIRGCPQNYLEYSPDYSFCIILAISIIIQTLIVIIQTYFGSRSLVPKSFLPKKFNYFVKFENQNEEQIDDCAICMEKLNVPQSNSQQRLLDENHQLNQPKYYNIMVTPCQHKFHIECLKSWLDVKLECPSCRQQCPPIDE